MKNHPLPTSINLDHPLARDVHNICLNGSPAAPAVALDQEAGWIECYIEPLQFDEDGNPVTETLYGIVTFDWSDTAQDWWNACGGKDWS